MTPAARFARARVELEEAMARGCTILELRAAKAAERARMRERAPVAVAEQTADLMQGDRATPADFRDFHARWMMRD